MCKGGKYKYVKSSTIVQGRKMQVRKKQVQVNRASIIALIQYYTALWVGYGSAVRVSASYSTV